MGTRSTVPQRLGLALLAGGLLIFFQSCQPYHSGDGVGSSSSLNGFTIEADPALQTQSLSLLSSQCASCHESTASGGVTRILDINHLVATGLVTPGNPNTGRLVGSMADRSMPPGRPMLDSEITVIRDWISSMRLVPSSTPGPSPVPSPALVPAGKTVQPDATLQGQAMTILNINCAGCHQGQGAAAGGGITNILDVNHLASSGLITVGDATKGRLIGSIVDASMPKGNGARVTAADLQILRNWINSMILVDDVGQLRPPTRPALSPTFTGVNAHIIQPKCIGCHGPNKRDAGRNYGTYAAVFNDRNSVLQECQSGGMPRTPYPLLSSEELTALRTWIQTGALNN